jgi:hypothetical protein
MKIDTKYQLEDFSLTLKVVKVFDFREEPILLLEKDNIGNSYLSYLVKSDRKHEQRIYLQISKERLEAIIEKDISLFDAYNKPENNHIYVFEFSLENGKILKSFLLPAKMFIEINPISKDYDIDIDYSFNKITLDTKELLNYSDRKQKLLFDFYLQSQNLVNSIKPYAFYKVFMQIVEIIKIMLEIDNRNADKYLAFSNIRQNSLGVTIEINYSEDLFLEKETKVLETLIQLLNAQEKEDFEHIISKTKNEKYIKNYTSIIKAVIDNNADLHAAYANPINKEIRTSVINKERAEKAKLIIDETFKEIKDIEEITGIFLEIDIDHRKPSFKILSAEEKSIFKGKIELSILEKVKNDFVNIGKETYKFTIKTIYYPETTVNAEKVKRYLIDYKRIENAL